MRLPPATVHLRRAQLILMLVVLIPTVLMLAVGIVQIAIGGSGAAIVTAILILTLCTTLITGYTLGSIFVNKGASLARVQNDFVSSVSHELKTPLTSMHLLLASLGDNRLPEEDRGRVVALLGQETKRLEELVNRLLELTRLETGAHVFALQPIDVADLVTESVAAFDACTLSQPTPIEVSVEPGLTVIGDRAMLVRALVNLLTNAWKYSGDDRRIAVRAVLIGGRAEITVEDNGIGMSRAEQRAAFARFTRGQAAIDRRTPGVGLGLAFVRAIARGNRVKVSFDAGQTRGTVARLRFKRSRSLVRPPGERTIAMDAAAEST